MTVFIFVFLFVAVLLILCGAVVYSGNISIIHDYHRNNVTDCEGYAKAMGKPLILMGVGALAAALFAAVGRSGTFVFIGTGVFIAAMIAGLIFIIIAEKKYNGGMFS